MSPYAAGCLTGAGAVIALAGLSEVLGRLRALRALRRRKALEAYLDARADEPGPVLLRGPWRYGGAGERAG
jgi:hypothetical protein